MATVTSIPRFGNLVRKHNLSKNVPIHTQEDYDNKEERRRSQSKNENQLGSGLGSQYPIASWKFEMRDERDERDERYAPYGKFHYLKA